MKGLGSVFLFNFVLLLMVIHILGNCENYCLEFILFLVIENLFLQKDRKFLPEYSLTKILLQNGENLPPKKSRTLATLACNCMASFYKLSTLYGAY
jgi:hypothetical protein